MSHVESIYQCSKCLYEYCIQCYSGCPDCGSEHVKIVGDNLEVLDFGKLKDLQ